MHFWDFFAARGDFEVYLVVMHLFLRATTKKVIIFFEEKVHPQTK